MGKMPFLVDGALNSINSIRKKILYFSMLACIPNFHCNVVWNVLYDFCMVLSETGCCMNIASTENVVNSVSISDAEES